MEKEIKEAQIQTKLQVIEEIKRWEEQGNQSIKQLYFRIQTLTITYDPLRPEKMMLAREERSK